MRNLIKSTMLWLGIVWAMLMAIDCASAATVTPLEGEVVEYVLNSWFDTASVFTAGVLYVDDWETKIFILDRNLWATAAGTGCEDPNWVNSCIGWDPTYWYHFQRWNNYWFNPMENSITTNSVTSKAMWLPEYSNKWYYWSTFIKSATPPYDYWSDNGNHYDLWWWLANDVPDYNNWIWKVTNGSDRKWPCPENFHVPSYWEIAKLWSLFNNSVDEIHKNLLIPFAGYRQFDDAVVYNFWTWANVDTSSPHFLVSSQKVSTNSKWTSLSVTWTIGIWSAPRANAVSVRCIYDSYDSYTKASNLSCEDGFHMEEWVCTWNTKAVQCLPWDATWVAYDIQEVIVNYDTGSSSWEPTPVCEALWCADGYHRTDILGSSTVNWYTITHYTWDISYTLNSWFNTQKTFTWVGTITISNWIETITILDRNLWATAAGTGCDSTTNWNQYCPYDETYWYHFQRWNNYWFKPWCETNICQDDITSSAVYSQVAANTIVYNPLQQQYYSNWQFVKSRQLSNWVNSNIVDLRWWSTGDSADNYDFDDYSLSYPLIAESAAARRWPCPQWFHVPSVWELGKIMNMMRNNTMAIHNDLLVPFAGYRSYNKATVAGFGSYAYLWSSSPNRTYYDSSRALYWNIYGYGLSNENRCYAYSIRCVYDSYDIYTEAWDISCEQNQKIGACAETWAPEHASYTIWDTTWTWNSWENKRNIPACGWTCNENYHTWANWDTCDIDTYAITWNYRDTNGELVWITNNEAYGTTPTQPTLPSISQSVSTVFTFTGWDSTVDEVLGIKTYTAQYDESVRLYTITWMDDEWNTIDTTTVEYWAIPTHPNPSKAATTQYTYTFTGWIPELAAVIWNAEYTAVFQATTIKRTWGGSTITKDYCPDGDFSDSYYDGTCGTKPQNDQEVSSWAISEESNKDSSGNASEWQKNYELQTAYEFAYENKITTMDTIEKADMEWSLTRIAMAKMLSKYAINVLWKKPANKIVPSFTDITEELNAEYDYWVSLAYQLWIMWINMPDNKFRPFDLVPRSEFVTALSRMKFNTPDGKDVYYSTHMELLKKLWIVTNTNPSMLELRGYVMLMLMRSEK